MGDVIPEFSVVLPAHNEAANVAPICAALKAELARLGSYEIIFVDDGSSDGTLDVLRSVATREPSVRYLLFTRNFGHQAALRAGLQYARGAAVIMMDADFEHPPQTIGALAGQWRSGFQVVGAKRIDDPTSVSFLKRATSNLYYRLLNTIGDVRIEPGSADFMLIDRVVVDAINRLDNRDLFLRGIVRWFGYPSTSVPYKRGTRQNGESKYTLSRMVELAVSGIAGHTLRPLRFAIYMALGFAFIGMLLIAYSIVSYFFVPGTVVGWTSIMAAIAILGAAELLVLGIFGEYLSRILNETRRRPNYIIAETDADPVSAPTLTEMRSLAQR